MGDQQNPLQPEDFFVVCTCSMPVEGWRHVKVTDRRTSVHFANCLKEVVEAQFPEAEQIVLVSDNLNTHKPAALYEAFAPGEARWIIGKLEWHDTPKHGSWLDIAEIELSVLQRQCLDRRIPDQETLKREVATGERERNQQAVQANRDSQPTMPGSS